MKPWVLGLCGGTCSGKSSLSRLLLERLAPLESAQLSFDSYYRPLGHLPMAERHRVNFDHPDSLDVSLFVDHLHQLRSGRAVEQPVYDFARHTRAPETLAVEPAPLIVADGILLLAFPEVRDLLDQAVFLDVPEAERLARRILRDREQRGRSEGAVREQFAETVAPMHALHVAPSAAHADLCLDGRRPLEELADELAGTVRVGLGG